MPDFAALETRANDAVLWHLSNAAATLPSTAVVRGIFDNGYSEVLGVAGSEPSFTARTSDVSGLSYGSVINIGGNNHTVRVVEPDGTGLTRLVLER
jgi:hypothetical protein